MLYHVSGQNNGSSFADLTGINVTITPTVANSKIHVHVCLGKVSHSVIVLVLDLLKVLVAVLLIQ